MRLLKKNTEAERERNKLEIKLSDLKGLARLTKKKELESRIIQHCQTVWICNGAGFLHTAFYTAQRATDAYQKNVPSGKKPMERKPLQKPKPFLPSQIK